MMMSTARMCSEVYRKLSDNPRSACRGPRRCRHEFLTPTDRRRDYNRLPDAYLRHVGGTFCSSPAPSPSAGQPNASRPPRPKLAVMIVVDQMRGDYVDRFKDDWTGGLHRMVTTGRLVHPRRVSLSDHRHLRRPRHHRHRRLPGAARHLPERLVRPRSGRMTTCTDDATVKPISYGRKPGEPESAGLLLLPTFAETMRAERNARVVSLSVKARSAIMLAGHGGDAVTWLNRSIDAWQTSTAFSPGAGAGGAGVSSPPTRSRPTSAASGTACCRRIAITQADDGLGEAPPRGWTSSFPHVLKGDADSTHGPTRTSTTSGSAVRLPTSTSARWRRRSSSR